MDATSSRLQTVSLKESLRVRVVFVCEFGFNAALYFLRLSLQTRSLRFQTKCFVRMVSLNSCSVRRVSLNAS